MNRRKFFQGCLAIVLCSCVFLAGCPTQSTFSALTNELGVSAASVAQDLGNSTLAGQITTDTAAAVAAINGWKSGTPAQNVVAAINVVITDLNLICSQVPNCGPYEPLIALALGTAASIIQIVDPSAAPVTMTARVGVVLTVPKDKKSYDKQWNLFCSANPKLAHLKR